MAHVVRLRGAEELLRAAVPEHDEEARLQAKDADDLDSLGSDEPPPLDALLRVTEGAPGPGTLPPRDADPMQYTWPGAGAMPAQVVTGDTLALQSPELFAPSAPPLDAYERDAWAAGGGGVAFAPPALLATAPPALGAFRHRAW